MGARPRSGVSLFLGSGLHTLAKVGGWFVTRIRACVLLGPGTLCPGSEVSLFMSRLGGSLCSEPVAPCQASPDLTPPLHRLLPPHPQHLGHHVYPERLSSAAVAMGTKGHPLSPTHCQFPRHSGFHLTPGLGQQRGMGRTCPPWPCFQSCLLDPRPLSLCLSMMGAKQGALWSALAGSLSLGASERSTWNLILGLIPAPLLVSLGGNLASLSASAKWAWSQSCCGHPSEVAVMKAQCLGSLGRHTFRALTCPSWGSPTSLRPGLLPFSCTPAPRGRPSWLSGPPLFEPQLSLLYVKLLCTEVTSTEQAQGGVRTPCPGCSPENQPWREQLSLKTRGPSPTWPSSVGETASLHVDRLASFHLNNESREASLVGSQGIAPRPRMWLRASPSAPQPPESGSMQSSALPLPCGPPCASAAQLGAQGSSTVHAHPSKVGATPPTRPLFGRGALPLGSGESGAQESFCEGVGGVEFSGKLGVSLPSLQFIHQAPLDGQFPAQARGLLGGDSAPLQPPSSEQSAWTLSLLAIQVGSLGSALIPATCPHRSPPTISGISPPGWDVLDGPMAVGGGPPRDPVPLAPEPTLWDLHSPQSHPWRWGLLPGTTEKLGSKWHRRPSCQARCDLPSGSSAPLLQPWPSRSSVGPRAGPWQCHLLGSWYMGTILAHSRCFVRLCALVEFAPTLLCWEVRGLRDGGIRVPRRRSDLGTLSVAFGLKAWVKQPLPEPIGVAWSLSISHSSMAPQYLEVVPHRVLGLWGPEVMTAGGSGPGWRRPRRGLKEGGQRGLEALSSQLSLVLRQQLQQLDHACCPWRARGKELTGHGWGRSGMRRRLMLRGNWTEDHGERAAGREDLCPGKRARAPCLTPSPHHPITLLCKAVLDGRGSVSSPHTGDLDAKPVETLWRASSHQGEVGWAPDPNFPGISAPPCPASASQPTANPVSAHTCLLTAGLLCPSSVCGRAHAPPAAPWAGSSARGCATGLGTGAPSARATGWKLETASCSSAQVRAAPRDLWVAEGRDCVASHCGTLQCPWGCRGQWGDGICFILYQAGLGFYSLGLSIFLLVASCPFIPVTCILLVLYAWRHPTVDGKWHSGRQGADAVSHGERACLGPFFGSRASAPKMSTSNAAPGSVPLDSGEGHPERLGGLGAQLSWEMTSPCDGGFPGGVLAFLALLPAIPCSSCPHPHSRPGPWAEPCEICDEDSFGAVLWEDPMSSQAGCRGGLLSLRFWSKVLSAQVTRPDHAQAVRALKPRLYRWEGMGAQDHRVLSFHQEPCSALGSHPLTRGKLRHRDVNTVAWEVGCGRGGLHPRAALWSDGGCGKGRERSQKGLGTSVR
ncbi:hypothetical protein Cadr_000003697 [Camelus dromedarius]|uniref:Uncharacterized protein n=1 Tax=Camelus dromedarius TaxID=9838 RepID=A0A5N4C364_CAMDR|nr:hypothetical protein Cadr_000003697 [Camelus dromedarius]